MNVFISADMEGICGVSGRVHWSTDGADYKRAREWMAQEVNAAIEGALQAGAKRVVVKDAHETATNIELDRLHSAAELISGWGPLGSMVEGVDRSFDVVFLIGYHARATTVSGTLAHTWSHNVLDLRINGQSIGEVGWAAAFAGHFDVPIGLVTGDDKLAAQVREELPDGVETVVTKTGWANTAAQMRPLAVVRDEIQQAARRVLANVASLSPWKPTLPLTLTIRFREWENLSACEAVPNVRRIAVDTFEVEAADCIEAQKYFATLHRLSRS
ncbi:MAG: M55 family metallopeptidase [Phycisphaerae bacterium]|nr:M55 family metallopeptidase [Phycisphaerae bacterium]